MSSTAPINHRRPLRALVTALAVAGALAVVAAPGYAAPPASPGPTYATATDATATAAKVTRPHCPRGATLTQWTRRPWRGWYGCVRNRREVQPRGCRAGYDLRVKRARGGKAYRCAKRSVLPPPAPPPPVSQPHPQSPPQTQPQSSGVTYQQLINIAFNEAHAQFRHDLYSTQYNYTNRVENGWINARLDSNRNVVSPVYAPGSYAEDVYWAEGCRIESPSAASCTLAERVFDGGDSSRPTRRTVRRKLVTVTVDSAGHYSVNIRHPDFFNGDVWYYVCFTGPNGERLSGVPYC
jgi:hypothetical protein